MNNLTSHIKSICLKHGFFKAGVSKAEFLDKEKIYFGNWLGEGKQATMNWLGNTFEKRTNPFLVMEDVKSIISLAYIYDTPVPHNEDYPKISRYAWGLRDYHKVLKNKLKEVCKEIEEIDSNIKTKFYVDDGPMMEKVWAVKSGIGWMGKNTNIINPDAGSFFFLCEILINQELEYDEPIEDMCKNCNLCLTACPTGALYDEYKLDANLCLSYQTIENREEIPDEINLYGWIYGCDICQDVCPYNGKGVFTDEINFLPRAEITNKSYDELLNYTEEKFNETFSGTPVKRTKYSGWIRNLKKAKSEMIKLIFLFLLTFLFVNTSFSQFTGLYSIVYNPIGKTYYICNGVGGHTILKRTQSGILSNFVTTPSQVGKMVYYDQKIFALINDIQKILVYDVNSAQQVMDINISAFPVSSLAIDSTNGIIYVLSQSSIIKINPNNSTQWTWCRTLKYPFISDICIDKSRNRLLACTRRTLANSSSVVYGISLTDSTNLEVLITAPFTEARGITLDRSNHVYISSWNSQSIFRYDINFSFPVVNVVSSLSNPLFIYINKYTDTLAIPNSGSGILMLMPLTIPTGLNNTNLEIKSFKLYQNYPNPFNPNTNINFEVSEFGNIELKIYNEQGKEIQLLFRSELNPGTYSIDFNAQNLTSGVYFCRLLSEKFSSIIKMVLIK